MLHRHFRAVRYCCSVVMFFHLSDVLCFKANDKKQSHYDSVTSSKATRPRAEVISTTRVSPARALVSQCRLVFSETNSTHSHHVED